MDSLFLFNKKLSFKLFLILSCTSFSPFLCEHPGPGQDQNVPAWKRSRFYPLLIKGEIKLPFYQLPVTRVSVIDRPLPQIPVYQSTYSRAGATNFAGGPGPGPRPVWPSFPFLPSSEGNLSKNKSVSGTPPLHLPSSDPGKKVGVDSADSSEEFPLKSGGSGGGSNSNKLPPASAGGDNKTSRPPPPPSSGSSSAPQGNNGKPLGSSKTPSASSGSSGSSGSSSSNSKGPNSPIENSGNGSGPNNKTKPQSPSSSGVKQSPSQANNNCSTITSDSQDSYEEDDDSCLTNSSSESASSSVSGSSSSGSSGNSNSTSNKPRPSVSVPSSSATNSSEATTSSTVTEAPAPAAPNAVGGSGNGTGTKSCTSTNVGNHKLNFDYNWKIAGFFDYAKDSEKYAYPFAFKLENLTIKSDELPGSWYISLTQEMAGTTADSAPLWSLNVTFQTEEDSQIYIEVIVNAKVGIKTYSYIPMNANHTINEAPDTKEDPKSKESPAIHNYVAVWEDIKSDKHKESIVSSSLASKDALELVFHVEALTIPKQLNSTDNNC